MQREYLGTAAAEGFPAVFCNCAACRTARATGEFRTRSQVLFDRELLVDFPPDTYYHSVAHGVDLSAVSQLLITHSHTDHFYAQELVNRGGKFAYALQERDLHVYGNATVREVFEEGICREIKQSVRDHLIFHEIEPFRPFRCGGFEVCALPANHSKTENCLLYWIGKEGKGVLYLNDTGLLSEEVYRFLEQNSLRADLVSLDCTLADATEPHSGRHMNLSENVEVLGQLQSHKIVDSSVRVVITHFSHNAAPLRARMEDMASAYGFLAAYDGLTVEV